MKKLLKITLMATTPIWIGPLAIYLIGKFLWDGISQIIDARYKEMERRQEKP